MALIVECLRGNAGFAMALPLRRLVFSEQEGYMPIDSPLLHDEYDLSEDTFHILAWRDECLVGTVGFTLDRGGGTAADQHFNFGPYVPADAVCAAGRHLCIHRQHRLGHRVYALMMSCFYAWVRSAGATHVKGVINPVVASHFEAAQYRFLSAPFRSSYSELPCVAVLLNLDDLSTEDAAFVARHHIPAADESHCRAFLMPGEHIVATEHPRIRALSIVLGSAKACAADGTSRVIAGDEIVALDSGGHTAESVTDLLALTKLEAVVRSR